MLPGINSGTGLVLQSAMQRLSDEDLTPSHLTRRKSMLLITCPTTTALNYGEVETGQREVLGYPQSVKQLRMTSEFTAWHDA